MAELLLMAVSALSFLIVCYGMWHWRRDRLHWTVLGAAVLGSGILVKLGAWDELEFMAVLLLEYAAGAVLAYGAARSPALKLKPSAAATGVAATCLLLPLLIRTFHVGISERSLTWVIGTIPAVTVLALPLALATKVLQGLVSEFSAPAHRATAVPPQERAKVLDMLGDGGISSEEAAELLDALGDRQPRGDELPLRLGPVFALIGGLAVVVGFVLPWGHVRIGGIEGYQAGYHVGFHGWLLLLLGVVPAMLACIPVLDRVIRQGMLRLVIASVGLVLAGSLGVSAFARGGAPGIGMWIVSLGFAVQIVGGLAQSRIPVRAEQPTTE